MILVMIGWPLIRTTQSKRRMKMLITTFRKDGTVSQKTVTPATAHAFAYDLARSNNTIAQSREIADNTLRDIELVAGKFSRGGQLITITVA